MTEKRTWTPEQFWQYVEGLAGDLEASQMREMMQDRGLALAAQSAAPVGEPVAWQMVKGATKTLVDADERDYFEKQGFVARALIYASPSNPPVAWRWRRKDENTWVLADRSPNFCNPSNFVTQALYAAPQSHSGSPIGWGDDYPKDQS